MRKRTRWFVAATLALLVVAAWPAGADPQGDYAIRLSRPRKVGERFRVTLKGRQHKKERVTMGARLVSDTDNSTDVEAAATAEIRAVDTKRQATRVAYTIERCVKTVRGQSTEVLPRGRVVVVELRGGRTHYSVDGGPAPKDVEAALGIVLSAHEPESATDDEIFGTRSRKRVGDEWPINAEAAARDFNAKGLKLEPSNIAGATKLVAARAYEGLKVLELSGRVRIANLSLPLPAGAQVEKSHIEALFWGLFPADPASPRRVAESMLLRTAFTVRSKKPDTGEEILVDALVEQGHQARYAPVKR